MSTGTRRDTEMKKDKEVIAMSSSSPNSNDDNSSEEDLDGNNHKGVSLTSIRFSSRNTSSKYDFVKVKVWLGDNADHYYVLSRFLLSRMLTVTKIPNYVAIKIALELKKLLIDNSLLDVSQSDLEANLFKLMERRGYGEEYISRYKMMTRYGVRIAAHSNRCTMTSTPVWARDFSSSEELITEFCRECRIVRKGLAGDLKKAMKDGKPIIIEGIHLDPSIYLMDDENKTLAHVQEKIQEANHLEANDSKTQTGNDSPSVYTEHVNSEEGTLNNKVNDVSDYLESIHLAGIVSDKRGENLGGEETDKHSSVKKEKSGPEPIIIPIVLKMAEFDHKALLEEEISTRTFSDKCLVQDKDKLISNLKTIQDYLCSFNSQGLTVVNISATTFPQTLDWLHGYLLECIEHGISSVYNENGRRSAEN